MLSKEQTEKIKGQLIKQIESTFPGDKKDFAKNQIESMNEEQLEQFLAQNNLIKTSQNMGAQEISMNNCIFCSILSGMIDSHKIDENKDAIAVLEINPISKGHVLVIPKEHIESTEKLPKNALTLSKKISSKIKTKLKSKDILIQSAKMFGHQVINIVPVYEDENINSQRAQANPEELKKLQKLLEKKQKSKIPKKETTKKTKDIILPKRIP